ncbi:hypothetical protein QJS66_10220 [Kocuria rhizophila]|nr:hypothetical protein QJS66_10220 [Kocuria rhizophila]
MQVGPAPMTVPTLAEPPTAAAAARAGCRAGEWVLGKGHDDKPPGGHLTAEALDAVAPENPGVAVAHPPATWPWPQDRRVQAAGYPGRTAGSPSPEGGQRAADQQVCCAGAAEETARPGLLGPCRPDHRRGGRADRGRERRRPGRRDHVLTVPGRAPPSTWAVRHGPRGIPACAGAGAAGRARATVMLYLTTPAPGGRTGTRRTPEQTPGVTTPWVLPEARPVRGGTSRTGPRPGPGRGRGRETPASPRGQGARGRFAHRPRPRSSHDRGRRGGRGGGRLQRRYLQFPREWLEERRPPRTRTAAEARRARDWYGAVDVVLTPSRRRSGGSPARRDRRHRIEHFGAGQRRAGGPGRPARRGPAPQGRFVNQLGDGIARAMVSRAPGSATA